MDEIGDLCNLECHSALYTLRVTSWSWKSLRIYTASQLLVGIEEATPLQHILKTHLHINKRHMRINIGTVTPLLSPKKLYTSHYSPTKQLYICMYIYIHSGHILLLKRKYLQRSYRSTTAEQHDDGEQTDRQTELHIDRQTDRETGREIDSQMDRQTESKTDRQTDRQIDRWMDRLRNCKFLSNSGFGFYRSNTDSSLTFRNSFLQQKEQNEYGPYNQACNICFYEYIWLFNGNGGFSMDAALCCHDQNRKCSLSRDMAYSGLKNRFIFEYCLQRLVQQKEFSLQQLILKPLFL